MTMSDVKRYEAVHLRYNDNNIRYGEGCEVEVVLASDYAALEAELARLRAGQECQTLNQRAFIGTLLNSFPLLNDDGLDVTEHHCEWHIQQERKRLHTIVDAARLSLSIATPQPSAVPDGWKLVPVEPTVGMLDIAVSHALAVSLSRDYDWSAYMRDVWMRMVEASLEPGK